MDKLFLLLILFVLSCNSNTKSSSQEITSDNIPNSKKSNEEVSNQNLTTIIDTVTIHDIFTQCKCGSSEIIVNTKYINDYNIDNDYSDHPIIISQTVEYKRADNSIKKLDFPFRKSKQLLVSGREKNVFQTAFARIKCLEKKGVFIVQFYGIGLFGEPHEFFGYSDINGKWLWYYYGSMNTTYKKYGSSSKFEKIFGKELNQLSDMINIYPPN